MKILTTRILVSALLMIGLVAVAGNALASVAANAQIINQATLSYHDGTGIQTASSSVTVTVALVEVAPAIVVGPDQSAGYTGPDTPLDNSFTITATANGPDSYDLTPNLFSESNTSGATLTVTSANPVLLGATVTFDATSTTTAIVVPADGTADAVVNGIAPGDTVVIGGEIRTVASVSDNATGTSTITLTVALPAAPGAGVLVAEQQVVTVQVESGTITAAGTDLTVVKTLTATSVSDPGESVTSGQITDTFTSGVANLTKYVRNVTNPVVGTNSVSYNAETYYQADVSAEPNDFLEYLLVASNSGSGSVSAAEIADVLPVAFVTLVTGAYTGSDVRYDDGTNAAVTYIVTANGDPATYDGTDTLTVIIDSDTSVAGADGEIAGGQSVYLLYRVSINP